MHLDENARDTLHAYAVDHPGFADAMRLLSTVGSAPVYLIVFGTIAVWLAWRRRIRLAAFVIVTMVGNSLLNSLVKLAVGRARPVVTDPVAHANGYSFPSGHAQSAIVAYGVLLAVFAPVLRGVWRAAVFALGPLVIIAIGFSRIALGVHFVSDVLAGYCLGVLWLTVMITVKR